MQIHELVYSPKLGYDVAVPITIDYDPKEYKTAQGAAKGLHKALVKLAKSLGQRSSEVAIQTPDQSERSCGTKAWRVIWEAGPYHWAVEASFEISGPWGYTEPYYSFDLCFVN